MSLLRRLFRHRVVGVRRRHRPTARGLQMKGSCHCETVTFEVVLSDGLKTARRCTCSYCRARGAVAVSAKMGSLKILSGESKLTRYTFNTGTAQHFFCSICGIYTHHQRRSNPHEYGINVACLQGLSPFDFPEVPVFDGQNHPADNAGQSVQVGILRFERN